MALKFDIQNENFDYFFLEQSAGMSEVQRQRLPQELMYKIYTKGNRVNSKSTSKLSFLEKIFILIKGLRKRWILIVEDDCNGMGAEEFFKFKELTKKRNYSELSTDSFITHGEFVLGNSELFDTYDKLNRLSVGPAYNYLMKVKTKNYLKPDEYKRNMRFLMNWINNYESKRKKLVTENGLTMAEWITLTYLYGGEEKIGSYLYKVKCRYSFNSSATKIRLSFGSLQDKGFIIRNGRNTGAKFQITALGTQKVNSIAEKYVVNC